MTKKLFWLIFIFSTFASFYIYGQTDTIRTDTTEYKATWGETSASNENSLGFNLGMGASLIRNTVTPTLNLNIHFYHDNKHKFQLGTMSNFFYRGDSVRNFKILPNHFIRLEMFWKNSEDKDKHKFDDSSWGGVGVGYLLFEKGAFFKGPTFKTYYKWGIGKGAEVSIELLVTNHFKTYIPGLTVTFM